MKPLRVLSTPFAVITTFSLIASALAKLFFFSPPNLVSSYLGSANQRNLSKFSFSRLSDHKFRGSPITLTEIQTSTPLFQVWKYQTATDENARVSGQAHLPHHARPQKPVVILLRGYVDKENYFPGIGTQSAAKYFASQGFFAFAPDFLGFGSSDPESNDILEARFEKPSTVLSLIASIQKSTTITPNSHINLNSSPIFIWAHSNGGQIALSILEIGKFSFPTTLWAPVSLGFPHSITHYFPELPDKGTYIQKNLDEFLLRYEAHDFSIDQHFSSIQAPIQIHQGGQDDAVPAIWSQNLSKQIPNSVYYFYPRSDHNLKPDWSTAIQRDLHFFLKKIQANSANTKY